MDDDSFIEHVEVEPFVFELANGNNVKIVFAQFWETADTAGFSNYNPEDKYFAIKIYSNEDLEVNRMAVRYVLRAGYEFGVSAVPTIWEWLGKLVETREHIKYDWLDEFVDDFAEQIAEITETKDDAVEHIIHLPEMTEPRILLEDPEKSYHAKHRVTDNDRFDNRLIFGDNLLALKALEQEFTGKIKCIYIDPPYNTGSAFTHYDDGLEHSLWLSLMRDRLELLKRLLRKDGIIFVHIDDNEHAYLKVLLDEIFGRRNFCGQFVWEKKKKPSFLNANMGNVTEYVLAYSPDRTYSPPFIGGVTTEGKKYPLNNAGNGVQTLTFPPGSVQFRCADGCIKAQDMSEGNIVTRLLDDLKVQNGKNANQFRLEGEWRYSQKKLNEIIEAGEPLVISKIPFRPNHIKEGGEDKKIKNLLSITHYQISTYEDSNAESEALFGDGAFDYPKPEKLISILINCVTEPGDWVMDSFAGSGTTGAVAHKMGRRWIMVELGEHCHTHIIPRMKKVIDGEDPGGITEAAEWKGGGGFRYYRLAPSLLEKDKWGQWVISKEFNAAMLAEALCKLEGFIYAPSDTLYWQHGHSTEQDFIYVTTQHLSADQLAQLSDEVGTGRTLLVLCAAFRAGTKNVTERYPNLTVKKIPKQVLSRCEWGHDDYSLKVENLPQAPATPPKTDKRGQQSLFSEEGTK